MPRTATRRSVALAALLAALPVVLTALPAAAQGTAPAAAAPAAALSIGSKAPALAVTEWLKGKPVKLGDGKVHVVEFWATWCGPCKVSIPHLTELSHKYAGKADFTGVSVWEYDRGTPTEAVPAKVKKFVTEMGAKMDYHIARDSEKGVVAKSWMDASLQNGIPTAFVVDKDGVVAWIGHPMGGLDEALGKIIAGTYNRDEAAAAFRTEQQEAAKQSSQQAKMDELFGPVLKLANEKKFAEAVAEMDKTLAANPDYVGPTAYLKYRLMLQYDEAAGQTFAVKMAAGEWKTNAQVLNAVAWGIVGDDTKIKKPDLAAGLTLAQAAAAASESKDPSILDTLAVAYSKNNDLDNAIATEEKAVSLLKTDDNPEMAKELKTRLAEFKAKKATK